MLECVINISEGRDQARIARVAAAGGDHVLDVHSDRHHHRSVLTVIGEEAARGVAAAALEEIDLREHRGVHPRLGAVDVVPFVALEGSNPDAAVAARDRFAAWFGSTHHVPCFRYGPERTLPEVRREAFVTLSPDSGPPAPHPTAGACAVGARAVLVAYNVWVSGVDLAAARQVAAAVRSPEVRALGLPVGDRLQVSMNLVDVDRVGPAAAFDRVGVEIAAAGGTAEGAELVGLLPAAVLEQVPSHRWTELDLSEGRTIEGRLAERGLSS